MRNMSLALLLLMSFAAQAKPLDRMLVRQLTEEYDGIPDAQIIVRCVETAKDSDGDAILRDLIKRQSEFVDSLDKIKVSDSDVEALKKGGKPEECSQIDRFCAFLQKRAGAFRAFVRSTLVQKLQPSDTNAVLNCINDCINDAVAAVPAGKAAKASK